MSEKLVALLEKWNAKAKSYRDVHFAASVRLRRLHYLIGGPTIVLSALVGTAVFATLEKAVELWLRLVVGLLSVAAAALAALQTFLRFSERAEAHRQSYVGFDRVSREIEQALASGVSGHELQDVVNQIRERLDELGQAPELSPEEERRATRLPSPEGFTIRGTGVRLMAGARPPASPLPPIDPVWSKETVPTIENLQAQLSDLTAGAKVGIQDKTAKK